MVTYSTNELISSSEFAKKFGTYLAQIKDNSVEKLAILKNNKVEAVIISKDEYENMKEALKEVESKKILQSIQSGLDDIKNGKTNPIDKLCAPADLFGQAAGLIRTVLK
ncbi:MAG: type II toxin-antitoxin system Phd/YefM family antitoxin [Aliarcobacter skirrowii]|nr:type II toxin-antitoxin system Phd/YefM family antitoxin [Aliarcobacter skirrowii]